MSARPARRPGAAHRRRVRSPDLTLRIGVQLPGGVDDAGDYLADARALDAAGVDSLWVDGAEHEPWLLLAAIAAVTGRARLVAPISGSGARLASSLATLDRLSRGRLALKLAASALAPADSSGPLIELVRRSASCPLFVEISGEEQASAAARVSDGLVGHLDSPAACRAAVESAREQPPRPSAFETWARVKLPPDREQWRQALQQYAAAGITGLLVEADPRLLDILRNPDEEDDRSDLGLAQG